MAGKGIAIIGRIAAGEQLTDGQTVKTKTLYEELCGRFPDFKIICVDTFRYRKRLLYIIWRALCAFVECDHIFVLLSKNGRRFFFPVLMCLNAIFHRRLYHDVIGGALPDEAMESRALCRQLRKFEINWVEFAEMKEQLERAGVQNVEVLPNFKRLHILQEGQLREKWQEPYPFVMFSRVIREKGINEAAKAIKAVNDRFGRLRAVLYIYGPVEDSYQKEFSEILKRYGSCVSYMGCVPFQESVQVLRDCFMLLFPTFYKGEGMPGTILDAFSAGLPVIATDWHFNGNLVRTGDTGYCYDWKKPELLAEYISYAVEHPEEINKMRKNCLAEAAKYTADIVMEQICRRMQAGEKVNEWAET